MTVRSVLVRIPGYPLRIEALLPDRMLAELAACIMQGGSEALVLDYGTATGLARMVPAGTESLARRIADRFSGDNSLSPLEVLHTLWGVRPADRAFREARNRISEEAVLEIAAEHPDVVVFAVHCVDDLVAAQWVADRLRHTARIQWIGVTGSLCETAPEEVLRRMPAVDGLIPVDGYGYAGISLSKSMLPSSVGVVRLPAGEALPDLDALPAPAYGAECYPSLADRRGKVLLFEIEEQRGCALTCSGRCDAGEASRTKSVWRLCEEVRWLGVQHGARAFSFAESRGCSSHIEALAIHLLREGIQAGFCRRDHVCATWMTEYDAVRMAGCESIQFLVDTASQRLQEDFYGRGVTISDLERLVARARKSGIFTAVRLLYPCPADDWHTFAEALRFIGRAQPDSVLVSHPDMPEQSRWFREPEQFGFRHTGSALPRPTRFPLPPGRWGTPGGRSEGQTATDVIRSQEALLTAIRKANYAVGIDERMALMARLTEGVGHERAFQDDFMQALCTGDPEALGDRIEKMNRALCVPIEVGHAVATPLRQAVGN